MSILLLAAGCQHFLLSEAQINLSHLWTHYKELCGPLVWPTGDSRHIHTFRKEAQLVVLYKHLGSNNQLWFESMTVQCPNSQNGFLKTKVVHFFFAPALYINKMSTYGPFKLCN